VAVDPRGRVDVVGATQSSDYYVTPGARQRQGRYDAVRTSLDMVPAHFGRTDGTGWPVPPGVPQYPLPGYYGGSTPECALDPFGNRVGVAPPPYRLRRMLIDFDGPELPPPAQNSSAILISRPPITASYNSMFLQWGFPAQLPAPPGGYAPIVMPEGVILWMTNNPVTMLTVPGANQTLRFPLAQLPTSSITFTAQLVGMSTVLLSGGAVGPVCPGPGSYYFASPAIWISY
jgi:hypothetical protein